VEAVHDTTVERRHFTPAVFSRHYLWAVAAILLLTIGVATWRGYHARQAADTIIAEIVDTSGVRWADDSTARGDGETIVPGRLASLAGEYTLRFYSGPTLRVVGAASLDIKSDMLVQLHQGQVTAQVPHSSIGFTIDSALVNVVDQGTQFGISVGSGRTDVIVFDGKVDLQPKVGDAGSRTRLNQGDCVQVDGGGTIARLADVRRDIEGRWWADDRSNLSAHVIARVSDNIHSGDAGKTFACYQTTIEGLYDDSLAYSDNPHHQWNGLTSDGLPEFLRGADYIKTFNDYRYMDYFEMKVELARPANLYVFFDDRVDPPDWLKANFEDTGVDIGLDEGPWLLHPDELTQTDLQEFRKLDVHTTSLGGGNSIDNVFSVWRRRCVNGGTVSLGHAGAWGNDRIGFSGKGGRAMYGIAATPLEIRESAPAASPNP
jgi:ferric-dicitrate binding protein FerR (iron transport regulator)